MGKHSTPDSSHREISLVDTAADLLRKAGYTETGSPMRRAAWEFKRATWMAEYRAFGAKLND